jgi:hypothetical protein
MTDNQDYSNDARERKEYSEKEAFAPNRKGFEVQFAMACGYSDFSVDWVVVEVSGHAQKVMFLRLKGIAFSIDFARFNDSFRFQVLLLSISWCSAWKVIRDAI